MDIGILGLALAAGLIAAFNPCGFAMVPAYLTLVVLGEGRPRGSVTAASRALAATAMMALGFLLVFGAFGLVIAPLAGQAQQRLTGRGLGWHRRQPDLHNGASIHCPKAALGTLRQRPELRVDQGSDTKLIT